MLVFNNANYGASRPPKCERYVMRVTHMSPCAATVATDLTKLLFESKASPRKRTIH